VASCPPRNSKIHEVLPTLLHAAIVQIFLSPFLYSYCGELTLRPGMMSQHSLCVFPAGRDSEKVAYIEAYLKANRMFRDYTNSGEDPVFSKVGSL